MVGEVDEIPDEELRLAKVPTIEAPWPEIFAFALALDGYETLGGFDACGKLANETESFFMKHGSLPTGAPEQAICTDEHRSILAQPYDAMAWSPASSCCKICQKRDEFSRARES